jgi:hypothetical protein
LPTVDRDAASATFDKMMARKEDKMLARFFDKGNLGCGRRCGHVCRDYGFRSRVYALCATA